MSSNFNVEDQNKIEEIKKNIKIYFENIKNDFNSNSIDPQNLFQLQKNIKFLKIKGFKSDFITNFFTSEILIIFRKILQENNLIIFIIKIIRFNIEIDNKNKENFTQKLLNKFYHLIIIKLLEDNKTISYDIRFECFKLCYFWLKFSPKNFPLIFAQTIAAMARNEETFKKGSVEFIRNLAIKKTYFCSIVGGFKILINSLLDENLLDISDIVFYTLIYIINTPEKRKFFNGFEDFYKIFAIFTKSDFNLMENNINNINNNNNNNKINNNNNNNDEKKKLEKQLILSKRIIEKLLKTWPGYCLIMGDYMAIGSVIEALNTDTNIMIKNNILIMIKEIIENEYIVIDNFTNLCSPSKDDFYINKIYLAYILQGLQNNNIYESLIKFIENDNINNNNNNNNNDDVENEEGVNLHEFAHKLALKYTILYNKLSNKDLQLPFLNNKFENEEKDNKLNINDILYENINNYNIININNNNNNNNNNNINNNNINNNNNKINSNNIISNSTTNNDDIINLKVKIMNILDQTFYHYNCNDITNIDQNLLSFEIIISMNSMISNQNIKKYNNQYSIESAKKELYKIDDENFNNIFKKSKIFEGKEYNKWEWSFIDEILDILENRKDFIMELYRQKFFKRLLYCYMPSKNQFVNLAWNIDNLKYVEVGNKFFKLLSESKEGISILDQTPDDTFIFSNGITWYEDVQNYLENLIIITNNTNNIVNINSNNSTKNIKENNFVHDKMLKTMSFYILTFLGIISQTSIGDEYLNKKGYYKLIEKIIESNSNNNQLDYIIKCLIDNFNFNSQNAINIIKNKLIKNCSKKLKRYLFEHIKCLLKFGKDILLDINFFIENLTNNNNNNNENNNDDSNNVIISILTNLALEGRYIEEFSKNQNLIKILETTTNKEILYIMMRNNKGFDNLKTFIDNEIKNININKIIKDYGNNMEDIMNNIFNNDDDFNAINNNNNYFKIYLPKIDNLYKNTYEFFWLKQLPFNVNISVMGANYLLNSYLEYIDDKNIILYSNFNNNNVFIFDINKINEIKFSLLLGSFFIDKNFRENNGSDNNVIFNKNDFNNRDLIHKEIDYYKIEKEGVIMILKPLNNNNNNNENKITNFSIYSVYFNIKIYPEKKLSLKTPINILTELPNNEKGFNILIENNFIEKLLSYLINDNKNIIINDNENNINSISNSNENIINNNNKIKNKKKYNSKDIKSVLWILSKILIKEKFGDLIENKYKIIEKIISYQKSCDDYAMKGTICYILCYISQNKNLKNIIENNNYIYYFNTEICYPKNINELYIDNTFIYENKKIKENYDKINKFINLNEKTNEIYNNITSLINNITFKQSNEKLIEIKEKEKNSFDDSNLLIKIYGLLCRFKFRQQIRRTILDFMDVAINDQETLENAIKIMDNIGKNLFEFNEEDEEEEEI